MAGDPKNQPPSWPERIIFGVNGYNAVEYYVRVSRARRRFRVTGHGVTALADSIEDARKLWRTRFLVRRAREAKQAEIARTREEKTQGQCI